MAEQTLSSFSEQATAIIGREKEVAEIRHLLADPQCRLLTLTGPGGIGKTTLATAATAHLPGFADGIHLVALQPVPTADLLVPAIATAAGLPLAGRDPLLTQLLRNLRHKQMLLLLDNFEHLKSGARVLLAILHDAPEVKLLVTSREVVGVRDEWLYPVHGLALPVPGAKDDPATYPAIRLFCMRARQVRRDFRWEDEKDQVIAICRQVEGSPLAVELAASWLAVLDSADVVAQLRCGMDILASSLRDMPERHRSMRAVFDHSWHLLNEHEQAIFARLSVFRGGFTLSAAQAVAGASLAELSALVAKSLVQREADGRFYIHELLRQYGAEKLAATPETETAAHAAHAQFFLAYLYERNPLLDGKDQLRAVREITVEHENVHSAWRWSVTHIQTKERAGEVEKALNALLDYYQMRSRYLEGAEVLADTIRHLESTEPPDVCAAALALCLTCSAWLAIRQGQIDEARRALARSLLLYDRYRLPIPQKRARHPYMPLMILALIEGNYDRAAELGGYVRTLAEQHNQPDALGLACYASASTALAQGDYAQTRAFAQRALAVTESLGDRWIGTSVHEVLGQIARVHGDLPAAKRHFEIAYSICVDFEAPGGMALHLKNLGDVAVYQREWNEAHNLYRQSLDHYQATGDRGGTLAAYRGLGIASYHVGDVKSARRYFRQALDLAVATQSVPSMLSVLAGAGEFMLEQPGTSRVQALGLRMLRFVAQHPSCDRITREEALACLRRIEATQIAEPGDTLETLIAALQAEWTVVESPVVPVRPASTDSFVPVEPLTAREVEVLRLLAAGRSNGEIAGELVVAVGTVKSHTSNIYRKLNVANRAQALARAHELGLLQ